MNGVLSSHLTLAHAFGATPAVTRVTTAIPSTEFGTEFGAEFGTLTEADPPTGADPPTEADSAVPDDGARTCAVSCDPFTGTASADSPAGCGPAR